MINEIAYSDDNDKHNLLYSQYFSILLNLEYINNYLFIYFLFFKTENYFYNLDIKNKLFTIFYTKY